MKTRSTPSPGLSRRGRGAVWAVSLILRGPCRRKRWVWLRSTHPDMGVGGLKNVAAGCRSYKGSWSGRVGIEGYRGRMPLLQGLMVRAGGMMGFASLHPSYALPGWEGQGEGPASATRLRILSSVLRPPLEQPGIKIIPVFCHDFPYAVFRIAARGKHVSQCGQPGNILQALINGVEAAKIGTDADPISIE